ncbi:MAG: hypothetical protein LBI77_01760 [Puniceicoccales bacterium]|jgi:hypothetical protein|nr:hypothetical protein [Puniceicoccales bacterium]
MDAGSNIKKSGLKSILDVGFEYAVSEGGTFWTTDGKIEIEQTNGKIKITELIINNISLEGREVKQSNKNVFKYHKEAMKYLNKNPNQTATVVKKYDSKNDAIVWLQRNNLSLKADIKSILMKETNKIENFSNCTDQQQEYIRNYAEQMIEGDDKPEFALEVCRKMALGCQGKTGDEEMIWLQQYASALEEGGKCCSGKIDFGQCTPQQQIYIREYAGQMILGGDKPEFALEVSKAMAILYKSGIENQMPVEIHGDADVKKKAENVTNKLEQIMNENGGDYEIMKNYLKEQQLNINADESQAMRYFLLTQRQNPDEERYLGKVSKEKMQEHFVKFCGGDEKKYAKTVAIYKAFTAIALNRVDFTGKNHQNHSCTVYRGLNRRFLEGNCPGYDQRQDNTFTINHNTLESTSIGDVVSGFNDLGKDTHEMKVPFDRIFVVYFMSPEMCGLLIGEREFICDLQGIEAKITRNL